MDKRQIAKLQSINDFPELVEYLREELEWPIKEQDFDDLTFDYTAEELGIDEHNAAKILEIKRLRPLDDEQPWGIFFLRLEPKRLPVVALRRLLSKISLKKRASANKADQAAWHHDDILFISNFGAENERQLSFAHFAVNEEKHDLPVLKVLGWDHRDTVLHVDAVVQTLKDKLLWPEDISDTESWRRQWREAFTLRHRELVNSSKEMALRLAELARDIRDSILSVLQVESDKGPMTRIMESFREALIHDLDEAGFADMYAQTIAYGLLSARIVDPRENTADDFASLMRTNPFLKELMETFIKAGGRRGKSGGAGIDFDELGVSEVVELLDNANMEAVIRDFGDLNPQEDPVIHFYELFLKEYDARKRTQRGVFYTPRPVVSYIVRSVDELLRTEFGLEDGLADTATWGEMVKRYTDMKLPDGASPDQSFVQILDPATGTGTFLVEVIDRIHTTMTEKWKAQGHSDKRVTALWNDYVPEHLLPRLHGYELLMAPYAIAHLKFGLKLYETGYRFGSEERARVYLTNALEPASSKQLALDFLPALAHEAEAVNEVKRKQRFTVVIGNPPYSGVSSNMTPWIDGLLKGAMPDGTSVASYYHVAGQPLGERKLWLQDDYVKFIRLSQHYLTSTGVGVNGYITNHGYLDNPTFRGMRWSLMDAFDDIHVLDLHGNLKKKESAPGGGKDVNVFDIQQGVGIGFFVRVRAHHEGIDSATVRHADLWGDRDVKYRWLVDHSLTATDWQAMPATEPFFLFEPFDQSEADDYNRWPAINNVMNVNVTGIVTARDGFVIDFDNDALKERLSIYLDKSRSDVEVSEQLGLKENYAWRVKDSREQLRKAVGKSDLDEFVKPILYRPFDTRLIFWHPSVVWRPRTEAMPHMLAGENLAIISCRQQARADDEWAQVGVTNEIIESCSISNITREINYLFPLYLYPGVGKSDGSLFHTWPEGKGGRRPNLDAGFVETITQATGLTFVSDGCGELKKTFGPEDVLAYIYAVFHSPEYRRRFEPMLKLDFPRVPPPSAAEPFTALAQRGHDLLALHLLESSKLQKSIAKFTGKKPLVTKVGWTPDDGGTVWLDGKGAAKNFQPGTSGFKPVPEEVWNFHIGGYQVCEKWLKDRGPKKGNPGRTLTDDDIAHYQKIVAAISETIRIMAEIGVVIEKHGGWPGAFFTLDDSDQDSGATGLVEDRQSLANYGTSPEQLNPSLFDEVADESSDGGAAPGKKS